jgi:choline dehydrogenase-like flavoprotein
MIVDLNDHEDGHVFRSDLVIIGAGAAGITIAREFFKTGTSVLLLESGGEKCESETQDLYTSEITGIAHKGIHSGRARIFGGTTTLWAGQTLPLDEIDFQERPWVSDSGWPLKRADLEPYYRRAEGALQVNPIDYQARDWPFKKIRLPQYDCAKLRPLVSQFSPRADFAAAYRAKFKTSRNTTVVLHANAVRLAANPGASRVEGVEVQSLSGKKFWVRGRHYVVACGGIETARLLLVSDDVQQNGLGNAHCLVGRYFQDHVQCLAARVQLRDRAGTLAVFQPFGWRGNIYNAKFALSERLQEECRTLNITLGVTPAEGPDLNSPVEAAKRLARGAVRGSFMAPPLPDLQRAMRGPFEILAAASRRLILQKPAFRMTGETYVTFQSECEPTALSRVTLSNQRDSLGVRRTKLDWRLTPLVRHTAIVGVETLAQELRRLNIGDVDLESFELKRREGGWRECLFDTNHHIGTTRMSIAADKGVVNRDCRVHSVENLFISSSSVFPTGGHSNPTFTILALGIRLADHLKGLLAQAA